MVTDENFRDQFFTQVKGELERAVGVRAVYLAAREAGSPRSSAAPSGPAPA